MEKEASQLSSKFSQVLNNDEKCIICKGLEQPSIIILSTLPKEKAFVKLICNQCLSVQQKQQNDDQQNSNKDLSLTQENVKQIAEGHKIEKKQLEQTEQTVLLQDQNEKQGEQNSSQSQEVLKDSLVKQEKNPSIEFMPCSESNSQVNSLLQTCDSISNNNNNNENSSNAAEKSQQVESQFESNLRLFSKESDLVKNEQILLQSDKSKNEKEKEIQFVEVKPAFIIEPHHVQLEFDQLISQFESSLKTQKFNLLKQSTELQQHIKSSLRVLYDIQEEVENMHTKINQESSKPESLVYQLKETSFQQDRQSLLEQLIQYVNLKENKIEAQLKQFGFQEKIDDILDKLEFLSESLQPNLFELNTQIYKIKKETVQHCNYLLTKINIQGKWKQYSDIQMDEEDMYPGMRGVYKFTISQNGRVSRGTNTGYVYLAMNTTERYTLYDFRNLKSLEAKPQGQYFSSNSSSKDPIASELANYFLQQRQRILDIERKISMLINS